MLLIKNAKIYTMENDCIIDNGQILIEDGKIKDIGTNLDITSDIETIDANGAYVFPGFVDAHCHLGMWEDSIGFEGNDTNEMSDPITPQLRAIDGLNPMDITFSEAYQGGVTSVATGPGSANVIGGQFAAVKTYGKCIDNMIIQAPLAMKCAFGENPKRVYNSKSKSPSTRMATAALLRETLFKALEYKNRLENKDSKDPAYNFKYEALLPVLRKEIPLKAHAHRADDILTAIRIAKEFDVNITLDHCTEGHLIADIIAKQGLSAIVGPTFGTRSKYELKNKSFTTPNELYKAGVKVAIMTDHPVIPCNHLPLCAALACKAGLPEMEALKAITINSAEILGLDDKIGSLKVGKDADIVLWNNHPFDINSNVICSIINGKVVYKK